MPPKPQTAEEIYREAQKESHLGADANTKIYNIRQSLFERTGFLSGRQHRPSTAQAAKIRELSKERSRHMAKHKRLMEKLVWDDKAGKYRLKK